MTNALYLAIDQGGQSSRAMLFDMQGRIRAQAQCAVAVCYPQPDWVEQDAEQLIQSIYQVIHEVTANLPDSSLQIGAAGIATQRSNVVCWRRDSGAPLSAAISWQDRRAHQWLQQFAPHKSEIQDLTGLPLSAHYGASKLRWCWDHLPEVQEAFAQQQLMFGPLSSFLSYRLTGGEYHFADPANASRSLLMSLKDRDWSPRLLALFGVPREPLPRCVPTVSDFGTLPLAGRAIPLRVTTGDQSAALFAFGEPKPDVAYINMGTGAFIQRSTGQELRRHPGLLSSIVYHASDTTHYVLEGTVNGAGSALRAMEETLGLRQGESEPSLEKWLNEVVSPPLFLNGIAGLGAPYWIPDFKSRFIGDGTVPERMVAVVESILFLIQENLQVIQQASTALSSILLSGGLAHADSLCQCLANLSGLPVQRPAQCEATAQGLAYLLSNRKSDWASHVAIHTFNPRPAAELGKRYHAWHEAMQQEINNYD